MNEFVFRLPEKNSTSIRIMNLLILVVNFATVGYSFWIESVNSKVNSIIPFITGVVCILGFLSILVPQGFQNFKREKISIIFLVLSICWFFMGYSIFGLLMAVLSCFAWISGRPSIIKINANGIEYPSFPVKKIAWNELTNIMLKDAVLSIDCKNNKLIQVVVDATNNQNYTEIEFNQFCKKALLNPSK